MKISDAKAVIWLVHQARMVNMSGNTFERIDAEFLEAVKEPPPPSRALGAFPRPTEASCRLLVAIQQRDDAYALRDSALEERDAALDRVAKLQERLGEAEAARTLTGISRDSALEARDAAFNTRNAMRIARDDALGRAAELQTLRDLALEREAHVRQDSINAERRAARLRSALLDLVQDFEKRYGILQSPVSPIGRARRVLEKNS